MCPNGDFQIKWQYTKRGDPKIEIIVLVCIYHKPDYIELVNQSSISLFFCLNLKFGLTSQQEWLRLEDTDYLK